MVRDYAVTPAGLDKASKVAAYRVALSQALSNKFAPERPTPSRGLQGAHEYVDGSVDKHRLGDDPGISQVQCASESSHSREDDRVRTIEHRALAPARAVGTMSQYFWEPGQTLKFYFQQREYVKQPSDLRLWRRNVLFSAFGEWARYSHLKFTHTNDEQQSDIRIFFYEQEDTKYHEYALGGAIRQQLGILESASVIGRDLVELSDKLSPTSTRGMPNCTMYLELPPGHHYEVARRMALHETGHALGLRHEQISPVTATKITQEIEEERKGYLARSWTYFDPDSIMLYPDIELERGRGKTVTNLELSAVDKWFIGVSST